MEEKTKEWPKRMWNSTNETIYEEVQAKWNLVEESAHN